MKNIIFKITGIYFLKNLLKVLLSKTGNYNYGVENEYIIKFLKRLTIYDCGYDLIRIGNKRDGGYLIPNILENIKYNFSAGVGNNISAEESLNKSDVKCFLADGTVNNPGGFDFIKKNINSYNDEKNITLNDWINNKITEKSECNLMLKLDIEGSEIVALLNTDDNNLDRISIMVVEFHDFIFLGTSFYITLMNELFDKLLNKFTICHIHPNNIGIQRNFDGTIVPGLLEITFINNKDIKYKKKTSINYPHKLDCKNFPNKKDAILPEIFYK